MLDQDMRTLTRMIEELRVIALRSARREEWPAAYRVSNARRELLRAQYAHARAMEEEPVDQLSMLQVHIGRRHDQDPAG